ncbi:polysaccharide deacetylase family protein [Rossellomorea oryzaecorticis]|uniref:Polysaccharide deacetylase family protein n=1 Tax=Rossellomorea oryzaecorticis TaxID=1396505 RepID=A0ABU9KDB1_9BACI
MILIIGIFGIYSILSTIVIRWMNVKVIRRVPHDHTIALTFDDGPHPVYTLELLDLLKRHGVKATFFVVGENAEKNKEVIKRIQAEGHSLGLHHYRHVSSWFLSPLGLKKQLERTSEVLKRLTGEETRLYRPPWGHLNLFSLFLSKHYRIVMWSHIFKDWKVKECKEHLLHRLRNADSRGSIFVLHDNGATLGADEEAPRYMLECLDAFIEDALNRNIRFISLDDAS